MTQPTQLPVAPSVGVERVINTLLELMQASESDTARIAAAKILLERIAPKADEEARQREAEERDCALSEARGLLAEFAAAKLAGLCQPGEMDQDGAAATTDAAEPDAAGTTQPPGLSGFTAFDAVAAKLTDPAATTDDA